ncbi:hypothetical protein [Marininema halotolerans]|nr:hypothetical protein [Marininema halotolerans]
MSLFEILICSFVTCNVLFFTILFIKEQLELPQYRPDNDYPADEQPRLS